MLGYQLPVIIFIFGGLFIGMDGIETSSPIVMTQEYLMGVSITGGLHWKACWWML